jgi:RIO-like serine/threonine protein kinase
VNLTLTSHIYFSDLFFCRKSLLTTLKSIHKAGVVHGDVRLANLCVNEEGKAFIIDFSHAKISSSRARMDYEIADLCALLDIKDTPTKQENVVDGKFGVRRSARIKEAAEKKANDKRRTAREARTRRHK